MSADWVTFRHPLGLSFRHPAGWRVQQSQAMLQLIPDGFDPNSEHIVAAADAAPVARIDDPAVIDYMDSSIRQVQPGLSRTADPSRVDCPAGEGIALDYGGQLGDGRPGAAVVYSVLVDGNAVSLMAIATAEQMAQRKPTLADVFATFAVAGGAGEAHGPEVQVDPKLVGTWKQSRVRRDTNVGGGTFDSSSTTYHLAPDGTYVARHMSIIGVDLPGGGGGGRTSARESAGTWSANGEFLVVRGRDGEVVVAGTYKVFANGIELYPAGSSDVLLLERVG